MLLNVSFADMCELREAEESDRVGVRYNCA